MNKDIHSTNKPTKKKITLSSGREVTFFKDHIPAEKVESTTIIVAKHNARDQSALSRESLKDILRTLPFQQFYPVIGARYDGSIEILDGSRRRAAAIICGVGLDIMITHDRLSAEEARLLSRDIQTSVEHNIREIGMRLNMMKSSGLTQKEIAKLENISQAKVTRAIQAAKVSAELISLFPSHNELQFSDFKKLLEIELAFKTSGLAIIDFVNDNKAEFKKIEKSYNLASDEIKKCIMDRIKMMTADVTHEKRREKGTTQALFSFKDKNQFARKKSCGRMFGYEFNRLPTALQDRLDSAIIDVLKKYSQS